MKISVKRILMSDLELHSSVSQSSVLRKQDINMLDKHFTDWQKRLFKKP